MDVLPSSISCSRILRELLFNGAGLRLYSLERISPVRPRLEASQEWTYPCNPQSLESKRHPGARGFAWSTTVNDNLFVPGNLPKAAIKFRGLDADRVRDLGPIQCSLEIVSQINNGEILPVFDFPHKFVSGDPTNAERLDDTAALIVLHPQIKCYQACYQDSKQRSHSGGELTYAFELIPKKVTDEQVDSAPDSCATSGRAQKTRHRHSDKPGQGGQTGPQPGHELREEQ